MNLIGFLQRNGWLPRFSRSEIDEAEEEDVSRSVIEHKVASTKSLATTKQFHEANNSLREAVRDLKSSGSNAFSDFERAIRDR